MSERRAAPVVVLVASLALAAGCGHDWDSLEPAAAGGSSGGGGSAGTAAGAGGIGGTAGTAGMGAAGTAGFDAAGGTAGAGDGGGTDGGAGAAGTGGDAGVPLCSQYSTLVTIGANVFCVGWWEAMNADYENFLDAGAPQSSLPECASDASRMPASWPYDTGDESLPVVGVDWCDAAAYCEWWGERLCGEIGSGAPYAATLVADASVSEWFAACSSGGAHAFPYGDAYQASACNGADAPFGELTEGSWPDTCEGGFPYLVNLSGNVHEWDGACDVASDTCMVRGGSLSNGEAGLRCDAKLPVGRWDQPPNVGIRCCSDPNP